MEGILLLLVMIVGTPIVLAFVALAKVGRLQRRVEALEASLEAALARGREAPETASAPGTGAAERPRRPETRTAPQREARDTEPSEASRWTTEARDASPEASAAPIDRLITPWLAKAGAAAKRWLTEGNVPVKVGVLVLFAGVAALIRHATEQGWLAVAIELRLAGIAALAALGLGFGWRQRARRRVFALSLQGGAIGVLLMVLFAASQLYALLPLPFAFALSVVLVAGLGVLGVVQDALALAVLGILAGFLAPLWLASGPGEPAVLFGYYALLNLGIFAMAWYRPWRILNLLGFLATFGIATAWGVLVYRPANFAVAQPFLLLFFGLYLLIPVFHARHRPPRAGGIADSRRVDGSLVFGTPLVAFGLQAALLEGARLPLAFCALGLALIYVLLAAWGLRREAMRYLGQAHAILAVGFATLAVPLALSARVSASVFALEGAALIWLGLRQQRRLPRLAGLGLQLLAGLTLLGGHLLAGTLLASTEEVRPLANATFMGGLLIAVAGLASAWSYWRAGRSRLALLYYGWGMAWWLGNGLHEIQRFVPPSAQADIVLVFLAASGALIGERQRRRPAPALAWSLAGGLLLALPLLARPLLGALSSPGWSVATAPWAWALLVLLGYRQLVVLATTPPAEATARVQRRPAAWALSVVWAQGAWLWAWPLFWSGLLVQQSLPSLGAAWTLSAGLLPWLAMVALLLHRPGWVLRPLAGSAEAWRRPLVVSFLAVLVPAWLGLLFLPGDPAPLPWWPLLNPLELVQWAILLVLWQLQRSALFASPGPERLRLPPWPRGIAPLAVAGFVLLTSMVLRGMHLRAGVPWSPEMFSSGLVQTGLTLLWSVLGVAGWIYGSRRRQRAVWLVAAVLMAAVLAKLVLVDRTHLGNLLGIVSFIGYGLLCIGVGYVAPAPPRHREETA